MMIRFLIIILIVIVSINSYDYILRNGMEESVGTLNSGTKYTFYLEAKSGQEVGITFTTSSTIEKYSSLTVYYYTSSQSSYDNYEDKKDFTFTKIDDNSLSVKFQLKYINLKHVIQNIILEFTPESNMLNCKILANIYGSPYDENTFIQSIMNIALFPCIICILCTITILCLCCKSSPPSIHIQNPTVQPLYPVNQPNQQTSTDVPPY